MKCYAVDECTWYAGNTPEEAQAGYLADCGPEVQEYMDEYGVPDEIDESALVCNPDEPGEPEQTVAELLATIKDNKPCFIATSEY